MPTPETNKPSQAELLALLGKAQAADLTAMKTASIINRSGHQITGFVVCHPETHERCIVEMSACRWLTNDEMWWLMHVSESPLNPKKPETFPCRECGKPGLGIPNAICPICGGE